MFSETDRVFSAVFQGERSGFFFTTSRIFYGPLDKEDTIIRSTVINSTSHPQALLLKPTTDTEQHGEEICSAFPKLLPKSHMASEIKPELEI